jgi:hypothetical protein
MKEYIIIQSTLSVLRGSILLFDKLKNNEYIYCDIVKSKLKVDKITDTKFRLTNTHITLIIQTNH